MSSINEASPKDYAEAASPQTAPERLIELYKESQLLWGLIASNPSAPISILDKLAINFPEEVLGNPSFSAIVVERDFSLKDLSLRSLVLLCLKGDQQEQNELRQELAWRLTRDFIELQKTDEASMSCVWTYQRYCTLQPDECENLIKTPMSFEVNARAHMEGEGPISLSTLPEIVDEAEVQELEWDEEDRSGPQPKVQPEELEDFLRCLMSGSLRQWICDDDIIREDSYSTEIDIDASEIPEGLSFDGSAVYAVSESGDEELLMELDVNYDGEHEPITFSDGYLTIPLEFVDEIEHKYELDLGELNELISFKPKHPDGRPIDWPSILRQQLST